MFSNSKTFLLKQIHFLKHYHRKQSSQKVTKSKWESIVGLEIHAQIATKSKLFSAAATEFTSPVNTNVSLFDAAIPGTLPVLNKRCVEAGVLTALALSCKLNAVSYFDRKHYFYADLPAGYQITQQRLPLAGSGQFKFQVFTPGIHKVPYTKQVGIKQIQLEQDSGKSIHDEENSYSLVDLNRAGIPLMELVFNPDLTDGEEAAALVKELTLVLQRLGTCSCKMEEGALRVDANISVNLPGEPMGVRSEVKNIGSIRGVATAIKYEIERQVAILESGGFVINETRSWDAQNKRTLAMRDKESVQDYRYMPEPNLPPLHLNMDLETELCDEYVNVNKMKTTIPELPEETREYLRSVLHVTPEQAIVLVNEDVLLNYFRKICEKTERDPRIIANLLINDFLTLGNKHKLDLSSITISVTHFGEIIDLLQSKEINLVTARKVLEELMNSNPLSPSQIIEKNNWGQIKDEASLIILCEEVIKENPKIVEQYLNGKSKVFGAFLGKIANCSAQCANMSEASRILKQILKEMLDNKNK